MAPVDRGQLLELTGLGLELVTSHAQAIYLPVQMLFIASQN